jgi:pimeloyl-ACP methyl ester carboxylesterase
MEIRRELVRTRHGYVHVRSTGDGGTPLVLLHYTAGSSHAFRYVLPLFGETRLVVAPDRLGFGSSDPPPDDVDMPMFARSTMDVLDHLGIDRFDLVGTHTGTVESLEIVSSYPDRVRRLVLVSVPLFDEVQNAAMFRKGEKAAAAPIEEDGSHLMRRWQASFDMSGGRYYQDDPVLAWTNPEAPGAGENPWSLEQRHSYVVQGLLGNLPRAYQAIFTYPIQQALEKIRQPLLVVNDASDLWQVTGRSRQFLPPHAVYVEEPDLDMLAFEVGPEQMAARILSFLDAENPAETA